ncbi:MAG: hypothetical protein IJH87_03700 [Atopobiaceae bacterium]|nr:hypothetical protein [Atopobiaceae bacterium]
MGILIDIPSQTLDCTKGFLGVIIPCAIVLLLIHAFVEIPRPVFRKVLHTVAFGSSAFMVRIAASWPAAALTSVLFAVVVYPLLAIAERIPGYDELLTQKKPGEVKKSLLLLFLGEAVVIAIGWGVTSCQAIAVAAILMWGVGDAAAALVGIYLGEHVIPWSISDGKKTFEGTGAMLVCALILGFASLILLTDASLAKVALVIVPSAIICAASELVSKDGNDTVLVPLATVISLSLLWIIL